MNYARLWKLKARARWAIAQVIVSALLIFAAPFLSLASSGWLRIGWLWIGLASVVAACGALLSLILTFRAIDQLEREDLEHKPWRSQPRGERTYSDQGGGA